MRKALTLAILLTSLLPPASALAQGTPSAPAPAPAAPPQESLATEPASRAAQRLDKLFEKLKESESITAARIVAADIERALEQSGSATTDLIFTRAKEAMAARDFDLATDLLDYVVSLRPQWAEPFHRRAMIHFLRNDTDAAYRDIREVLMREPRHYIALAGLGGILRASGNAKGAYKAYTKALEIHPYLADLKEQLERMRVEVEGQPI
jgi:tetratricopeptide (TPR) repeat protein